MGATTNPQLAASWNAWTRTFNWGGNYGFSYILHPELFIHQYTQCWIDLRGVADAFMWSKESDYFEDSRRATRAQQQYAIDNIDGFPNYGAGAFGLTACDGPNRRDEDLPAAFLPTIWKRNHRLEPRESASERGTLKSDGQIR